LPGGEPLTQGWAFPLAVESNMPVVIYFVNDFCHIFRQKKPQPKMAGAEISIGSVGYAFRFLK
jgi:hypothetical protein